MFYLAFLALLLSSSHKDRNGTSNLNNVMTNYNLLEFLKCLMKIVVSNINGVYFTGQDDHNTIIVWSACNLFYITERKYDLIIPSTEEN